MTEEQAERIASTLERIEAQNETIICLLRATHNANQNNLPPGMSRSYFLQAAVCTDAAGQ